MAWSRCLSEENWAIIQSYLGIKYPGGETGLEVTGCLTSSVVQITVPYTAL